MVQIKKHISYTSYWWSRINKKIKKSYGSFFKKDNSVIIVIGKTFGHLNQSVFLDEIYSISEGPPPEINLLNEKNNGEMFLI